MWLAGGSRPPPLGLTGKLEVHHTIEWIRSPLVIGITCHLGQPYRSTYPAVYKQYTLLLLTFLNAYWQNKLMIEHTHTTLKRVAYTVDLHHSGWRASGVANMASAACSQRAACGSEVS